MTATTTIAKLRAENAALRKVISSGEVALGDAVTKALQDAVQGTDITEVFLKAVAESREEQSA